MSDTPTLPVELKNLTPTKVFQPTPAMRIWLETALQLMTDSITEIEVASKITAQSWYGWIKQEDFREWYNNEWNNRIRGHAWKLDVIGMKNAKRDYNYWKTMRESIGKDNQFSEEATFTWRKK